jgi:hypothetical protein
MLRLYGMNNTGGGTGAKQVGVSLGLQALAFALAFGWIQTQAGMALAVTLTLVQVQGLYQSLVLEFWLLTHELSLIPLSTKRTVGLLGRI